MNGFKSFTRKDWIDLKEKVKTEEKKEYDKIKPSFQTLPRVKKQNFKMNTKGLFGVGKY